MPETDPRPALAAQLIPGVVNSNDLNTEISARFKDRENKEALEWGQQQSAIAETGEPQPEPAQPTQPTQQQTQVPAGAIGFEFPSATDVLGGAVEAVKEAAPVVGGIVKDVARGVTEAPRQVVGGLRDAGQEILNATDSLGDWLTENVADLGAIQITDAEGNIDLDFLTPSEVTPEQTGVTLPDVKQAETTTGNMVRKITQFAAGFVLGGKALPAGTAALIGQTGRAAAQGAISDFTVFDPHEERLSNLIEEFPQLQNPVTEFLAADADDSEIEGRFKNAIEGLGIGAAADGLFRAVKLLKTARIANAQTQKAKSKRTTAQEKGRPGELPPELQREVGDLSLLGDPEAKLVTRRKLKAKVGVKQTEAGGPAGVTPEDVAEGIAGAGHIKTGTDDVFINWSKIDTADDIKRVINEVATAFKPDIDVAKRGKQTNAQTRELADKENAWQILLDRQRGTPLNAEQSVAARELWASAGDKLLSVAEIAEKNSSPENLLQFRRMLAVFHAIQKEVLGARAETARALQSWAMPVGTSAEKLKGMSDILEQGGGLDTSRELAEKFAAAGRGQQPLKDVSAMAEKGFLAKTRDVVQEAWVNSLLSGVKTHLVNIVSNTSVLGLSVLERAIAARMPNFSGEAGVEMGEALAQLSGLKAARKDALWNMAKAFKTGQTGFGLNKIETPRTRAISSDNFNLKTDSIFGQFVDLAGAAANIPGRALQAEDEFFKTLGYRQETHAQAHRMAQAELRAGKITQDQIKERMADIVDNPPENIRMESSFTAAYQTFTNQGGPLVKGINRLRNEFPSLRFIVPFVNTPANIMKFTFERTPLAPLSAKYRNAIAKGGADAQMARAKMALGTTLMATGYDLAMDGHFTGSGPTDPAEKANFRRRGMQPYSIRFGDTSIAYNRLDPLGSLFAMAADIAEYTRNAEGEDVSSAEVQEALAATVFSVAENATSKSYLQGLSMIVEAINEPDRFSAQYIERLLGSFVPTIVAEGARATDPYMRTSHDILSAIKNRLPVFNTEQPVRRDLWGRAMKYESGLGTAYDVLSPLYGSTSKPEPIDDEMFRSNYFISNPRRGMTVPVEGQTSGEEVSFKNRPEMYSRYMQLQGGTRPTDFGAENVEDRYGNLSLRELLNDIVTGKHEMSADYNELEGPEDKEHFVMKIVTRYRKAARARMIVEFPELLDIAENKTRVKKAHELDRQVEELQQ